MPLEWRQDDLVMRVDGDVFEIFRKGAYSHRIPLAWLAVQVQPSVRGKLIVKVISPIRDMPFYEVVPKAKATLGSAAEIVIASEEEPDYRQFFAQVAQVCGRY